MIMLAAIAVTAVVVGAATALIARRTLRMTMLDAMGAPRGSDPLDEHHRLVADARRSTAEAEARAELVELSLDALSSGVIVTDIDGKVLLRNRLAADGGGRPHEQALIFSAATELLATASDGEWAEREVDVFGPPARTLLIHAVPITQGAKVVGALAVVDDVTDAHRIDKTRRDFVANLSHELRTPVGAASLLCEMLADEDDDDTRTHLTDRLLAETDRMATTIDDLLELSRIESEQESYEDEVDARSVVSEALSRIRVAAETRQVEVGSIVPEQPITLRGNHDQLVTALVNLVENAVKYSSAGDSVSVRCRLGTDVLQLIVQDTGRGIPARDLDRIFERFYRVDRSRDTATGGTGIGLSIVRHVALNHGGRVEVSSFEGDGSTFTMVLPRDGAEPLASPSEREDAAHP